MRWMLKRYTPDFPNYKTISCIWPPLFLKIFLFIIHLEFGVCITVLIPLTSL